MIKGAWILCLVLLLAGEAPALVDHGGGPRSSALGGALTGAPGTVEAVWSNPAPLAVSRFAGLGLGQENGVGGLSVQSLAGGWGNGYVGVALLGHLASASDTQRDSRGRDTGEIRFNSTLLGAAVAGHVPVIGLALGLGLKLREERLTYAGGINGSDEAAYLDLGVSQKLGTLPLRFNASLRDFTVRGSSNYGYYFSGYSIYGRNPQILLGLSFLDGSRQLALLEAVDDHGAAGWSWRAGYEISPFSGPLQAAFRLGYNSSLAGLGDLNGASFGLGLGWNHYWLDYAFVPLGDFGASSHWAMRANFALPAPAPRLPPSPEQRQAKQQARKERAERWYRMGKEAWEDGDRRRAIRAFKNSLRQQPNPALKAWLRRYIQEPQEEYESPSESQPREESGEAIQPQFQD